MRSVNLTDPRKNILCADKDALGAMDNTYLLSGFYKAFKLRSIIFSVDDNSFVWKNIAFTQ